MIDVFRVKDAPGFARHSSSFKNDPTCEEVHFVVGEQHGQVLEMTRSLYKGSNLIDYDVNWSTEGDKWVGVTCKAV